MEVWVDLKTVQWAYAHCQQYASPTSTEHYTSGIEQVFRFHMVRGSNGCVLRHKGGSDSRITGYNRDQEILLDFEDEQAHLWFMLRWSHDVYS